MISASLKPVANATSVVFAFAKGHGKKSNPEGSEMFHCIVAKGLFICKRARPDVQQTIAGLCARVKEPHESD